MAWYIIISWSVLCKDWIGVFKVKNRVKIQNYTETFVLYFLCHWFLCNQTRCEYICSKTNNRIKYNNVDIHWQ